MYTLETFYKSKEWEKFRDIVINESLNDKGDLICAHCGKVIVNRYDTIVHHTIKLTDTNVNDYTISLNPKNVEVICFKCHNKEHKRFGYEAMKQVYIVYGPPCGGKTTWVHDNASPNDLIVDMDSIHEMVSVNNRYVKNGRLSSVVFEVRDKLYDVIKYRSGKWQDAYVIIGAPYKMDRERLMVRLGGASLVYIDTAKVECYKRLLKRDMPYKQMEEWQKYIDDWFDKYQE